MFFSLREDGEDVYHTSLCGDYEFETEKARVGVSYKFLWKSCDPVGGEDDDRTVEGIVKKCDKSNH